ncbi:hypothetical protein [Alkalilimnicola ehrlichii]|uniref:hypothetical protein n=1 Tax=Alkalilimnicola ehrlichii TaxID=351052 RepID=UPI003BA1A40F
MKRKIPWRAWRFLHGRGHHYYVSREAKRIYGMQLISLSEKVFWFTLAPLLGYFLRLEEVSPIPVAIGALTIICSGMYLRHQGLLIIDQIETKEINIEVPPGVDR